MPKISGNTSTALTQWNKRTVTMQTISLNKTARIHRCWQIGRQWRWLETDDGHDRKILIGHKFDQPDKRPHKQQLHVSCGTAHDVRRTATNGRWTHLEENFRRIRTLFSTRRTTTVCGDLSAMVACLPVSAQLTAKPFGHSASGNVDWLSDQRMLCTLQLIFILHTSHTWCFTSHTWCIAATDVTTDEADFPLSNICSVEVEQNSEALAHETTEVVTLWTAAELN